MTETALLFIEAVSGPSSRGQFQFADYVCSNYRTILLTRSCRDEIPPQISDRADKIYAPSGGSKFRRLVFPLFAVIMALLKGRDADIVFTLQGGEAVLPSYIVKTVLNRTWVLLVPDVLEGRYSVIKNFSTETKYGLRRVYHQARFKIELLATEYCDIAVYSDLSEFIDFNEPSNVLLKGGVDCTGIKGPVQRPKKDPETIRVLYVGNMYYQRGIDILLGAIELVEKDVELKLIGPTPNDAARSDDFGDFLEVPFIEMVEALANVEYLGELGHEEVLDELVLADIGICLLPYERGLDNFRYSYPIKIFEYMATGTAVIATETDPTSDLLSECQLLAANDPALLAAAISRLGSSRNALEQIKTDNLERVRDHCWESLRRDLDDRLSELVAEQRERETGCL